MSAGSGLKHPVHAVWKGDGLVIQTRETRASSQAYMLQHSLNCRVRSCPHPDVHAMQPSFYFLNI